MAVLYTSKAMNVALQLEVTQVMHSPPLRVSRVLSKPFCFYGRHCLALGLCLHCLVYGISNLALYT